MVRTLKSRTLITPFRLALLAGVSSVVLTAGVLLIATRTVQADARLPRSGSMDSSEHLVENATPVSLAPKIAKGLSKYRLHGLASWYGGRFDGHVTASGEVYDMYGMTACHPTLPFGTLVRVINRANHRSVVVRITDRGDLVHEGRIIDLSFGAAEELAMINSGIAAVDVEVLSIGKGLRPKG